jgi:Bacterial PH domain
MFRTYPSRVDGWLILLLAPVIVIEIGIGVLFLAAPPVSRGAGLLIGAACFGVAGMIAWFLLGTRYEVGDGVLVARSGPFRFRIPLDGIREVSPTSNALSAPACSLDRLRIDYEVDGRRRSLLVSPKDKEGFLRELRDAVPGSRIEGDRLVTQR